MIRMGKMLKKEEIRRRKSGKIHKYKSAALWITEKTEKETNVIETHIFKEETL